MDNEIGFEDLPEDERAPSVKKFEVRLRESNEREAHELNVLEAKVQRLEALADEQERIADAMEKLVERSRCIRL